MIQQRLNDSSVCGCDEAARRLKACSQISVMTYFTEPSWRVVMDPFEKRVAVTIGDRRYGDTDSGDEDMVDLYVRTPSTLHDLVVVLIAASRQLEPIAASGHRDLHHASQRRENKVPTSQGLTIRFGARDGRHRVPHGGRERVS